MQRILVLVVALLLPAAVAAQAPDESVLFADAIEVIDFSIPVAMEHSVRVRFPVGELEIVAADVSEVHTELEVRCQRLSEALCAKYSKRLRLEGTARRHGDRATVGAARSAGRHRRRRHLRR